jgi:HK97 family phage portal protein
VRSLVDGLLELANKAPVPYVSRSQEMGLGLFSADNANRTRHLRAMGAVGTLFSIVNRTSTATSQVVWHLYRKQRRTQRDADRVPILRHLAWDIWTHPNDFYTPEEFRETVQQHLDLTGEGWIVVARNPLSPLPLELWPVRPDRMEPVPGGDFLRGYIYKGPDGENVPLELNEVIQLKYPNPMDPFRGLGPVQSILSDIDSAVFSAEWNRNFFINGAEPGGIIEVEKMLNDTDFDKLRERWREQHQGVANAHRVAILEQGKWKDRKFSMRDMQFSELRRVSRDVILEAFGMPKSQLGIVEDVNRANADAGEVVFARWITKPRATKWKGMLNSKYLRLFGEGEPDRLEFDHENVVPVNREDEDRERDSKFLALQRAVEVGFQPDAVVDALDLPEMEHSGVVPSATPSQPPTNTGNGVRHEVHVGS